MMDRSSPEIRALLLQIVGQLPTDQLLKALAVAHGGELGGPEMGGDDFLKAFSADGGGNSGSKIQSWNDRSVKIGGSDRPSIADKKWAEGAGDVSKANNPRVGQVDDGVGQTNIFLQTGGGA